MSKEAMKQALEALEELRYSSSTFKADKLSAAAITTLRGALAQPEQEHVDPEPFGYFQYDIRLDAWVHNRINNKGAAFYTAGGIRALKHRIHDQDLMLEQKTARIVDLQTHIENLEGEQT